MVFYTSVSVLFCFRQLPLAVDHVFNEIVPLPVGITDLVSMRIFSTGSAVSVM